MTFSAAVHESFDGTKRQSPRISEPGPLLGVELSRPVTAGTHGDLSDHAEEVARGGHEQPIR